jgi:hypothetical protein
MLEWGEREQLRFVCGKGEGEFLSILEEENRLDEGLPCGSCQGYGDVEGRVWHLQSVIGPALGLIIVVLVLVIVLVIAMTNPTHHAEILTLLGTLAGSVVGFYFRGRHSLPKVPQARTPKLKPPNSPTP